MGKLITSSLINSVDWVRNCPRNYKEKAFQSLKNTLGRAKWDPTPAIEQGIKFEDTVYRILGEGKENDVKCSKEFRMFLDECKGGYFQSKAKYNLTVDGVDYFLYGKLDVEHTKMNRPPHGHIIDIKTTGKWSGPAKYLDTYQHKIYCLAKKIPTFTYLVAVWQQEEYKIKEVHKVEYTVPDSHWGALENDIKQKVWDTMDFIRSFDELSELYDSKFCLY